jgi:hypothetical protein
MTLTRQTPRSHAVLAASRPAPAATVIRACKTYGRGDAAVLALWTTSRSASMPDSSPL